MDAGFLRVVESGQHFMTKDTRDLTQFNAVACREYTLPREEEASQPKGWIQGNTKIGPVLEVATSYLHGKHGVEVRIMSLSRDNTHSWVRISHGSNKFVINLNNNETEIPEARRICVKTECKRFCMPIEGKSNTTKKRTCWLFSEIRSHWKKELDRYWTREIFFLPIWGIEESNVSSSSFTTNASIRRCWTRETFSLCVRSFQESHSSSSFSASTSWRGWSGSFLENKKNIFRVNSHNPFIGLTVGGKHVWQQEEGVKKRFQYCTDDSGTIVYFRALQGHSGRNLIDPSLQDNVVIGRGIFHYIYHVGCAFNLHSIINNGLIPEGQDLSRRQTVFFLSIDPRDESHKDPEHIDFSVPRRARYVHSAWKRHQDAV